MSAAEDSGPPSSSRRARVVAPALVRRLRHLPNRGGEPAPVAERPRAAAATSCRRGSSSTPSTATARRRRGVPELSYGLRPTRWTRAGTWHRTLSWHDALPQWRPGIRFLPEHERIMGRLHDVARHGSGGTTYFSATPPLSLDASADVWPLLREARGRRHRGDARARASPGRSRSSTTPPRSCSSSSAPPTAPATSTSTSRSRACLRRPPVSGSTSVTPCTPWPSRATTAR